MRAEKVGSDRLRARKVSVIFIPAAESLPRQGTGKLEQRFRALLHFREELRIPETARPIMCYTDAFPQLYGKDKCHFSADVAETAFLKIVTDAVKHMRTIPGNPQRIVVVVCAGWNAPGNGTSRRTSLHQCAKQAGTNDDAWWGKEVQPQLSRSICCSAWVSWSKAGVSAVSQCAHQSRDKLCGIGELVRLGVI